jgi:hypothetical protein
LQTAGPIYSVGFNTVDASKGFVVTGLDYFHCFRYAEGELTVSMSELETHMTSTDYRCATWTVDGNLLIGNNVGEVAVLSQELQERVVLTVGDPEFTCLCITSYYNGFLVGGADGLIYGFALDLENRVTFYRTRAIGFSIPDCIGAQVVSLSVSN